MSITQILLLGPPEIRYGDRSIYVPRRIPRALLFYLASQGSLVGRDSILPLFWENLPDINARRRLSDTLSRLRDALPDPGVLMVTTSLVGLNLRKVYIDQFEFQNLLLQIGRTPWQISPHLPLPELIYDNLLRAVELWRYPRFLAGADFPSSLIMDNWLTQTSQKMENLLQRALVRLAQHAEATGDLEQALNWSRQALIVDELNEDLHYRVMHLLIELGMPEKARQHFHQVEALMQREYGASPSPRLRDLYQQASTHRSRVGAQVTPSWKIHPTMQVPFVGRKNILEQLQRLYLKGGGVFIFGESGQGKTRLMQEFVLKAIPQPRLLLAYPRPTESNLPFQPIIEVLRTYIQPEEWQALPAIWISQLSLLLPELSDLRPDVDEHPVLETMPEVAPDQVRAVILEALRRVFLMLSRQSRLIFCLDDAQWCDEATLATIAYLLERPPFDERAFFLAAARWEEKNPHLDALVSSLQQAGRVTVIPLPRLNESDIKELTTHVMGYTPPFQFTHRLQIESGGNPFFILESLRAILETNPSLDHAQVPTLPLVQSVQNLINIRLDKLPDFERQILEVAAIMGSDLDPDSMAEVMQRTPAEVSQALEELERRSLIELSEHGLGTARYRFIHEKIKEVLLQRLHPLEARLLHRKVARALEQKGVGDDHAAILAQHYEQAGELSLAFDYWVRAGRRARQLFSSTDALWIFSRANHLAQQTQQLTDHQLHTLYSEWTETAYEIEDVATIQRINSDLLNLGKQRNSPLLIGTALDGMSDACLASNQFEEGLDYTIQAIPYLEQAGSLYKLMEAYNHQGVFLYMLNRLDEALESFHKVLSLGENSQDPQIIRARANAHYQIAVARVINGWPEIAQTHAQRSLTDFIHLKRVHGTITAYSALALAQYFLGNYSQARQNCQHGLELAERAQAWRMMGYLHSYQAMIELGMGELGSAVEHAEKAIQLGERYNHSEIIAGGYRMIGDFYSLLLSRPQESVRPYTRALEASQGTFLAADIQFRLGFSLFMKGEQEKGQALILQAIAAAEQAGLSVIRLMAQTILLYTHYHAQNWEQIEQAGEQLLQEAGKRSLLSIRLAIGHLLGELAQHHGDKETAKKHFREIANTAALMPNPWLEIQSLIALHKTLSAEGQVDPSIRQRVEYLLTYLGKRIRRYPYLQAFREYRQRILQTLV